MRKVTLASIVLVAIIVAIIAFLLFFYFSERSALHNIGSFVECAENGYPVAESYPRQCRTPDGRVFVEELSNGAPIGPSVPPAIEPLPPSSATSTNTITALPASAAALVRTINISPGEVVASPLTITGEARGTWFFEASFPIELQDANGATIATGIAIAQSDWMTENFVAFMASFPFTTPSTKTGTIVLRKDNPSGLPEHDAAIFIPVTFGQ